jgi:hypothetical protein
VDEGAIAALTPAEIKNMKNMEQRYKENIKMYKDDLWK